MEDLTSLVARLVSAYEPEQVMLCPGAGRDADPLDLLVVKKTEQHFLTRREDVLRILGTDRAVEIAVYTPQEIEEMCRRENPYLIVALEQGEELYRRLPATEPG